MEQPGIIEYLGRVKTEIQSGPQLQIDIARYIEKNFKQKRNNTTKKTGEGVKHATFNGCIFCKGNQM